MNNTFQSLNVHEDIDQKGNEGIKDLNHTSFDNHDRFLIHDQKCKMTINQIVFKSLYKETTMKLINFMI